VGPNYKPLQILTQKQPFPTAVSRFAQHNEITIFRGSHFGLELVTSDTYIAALEGMREKSFCFQTMHSTSSDSCGSTSQC
jgi:hypothetical protein